MDNFIYNEIIFYSASFLIIAFGILTLVLRNIFYSLLSAIVVFFMTAVLFLLLGSQYNAIIQMTVYGFAVPVILGLGIMFTNMKKDRSIKFEFSHSKYSVILVCGIFIMALVYILMLSLLGMSEVFSTQCIFDESINSYSNFMVFSNGIFTKYVWGFELVSVILTLTVAGLTVIKNAGRKIR